MGRFFRCLLPVILLQCGLGCEGGSTGDVDADDHDDAETTEDWRPVTINLTLTEQDGVVPVLPAAFVGDQGMFAYGALPSFGAHDTDEHCISGLFFASNSEHIKSYPLGDDEASIKFSAGCTRNPDHESYIANYIWRASEGTLHVTGVDPLQFTIEGARMAPQAFADDPDPAQGTFLLEGSGEIPRVVF